MSHDPFYIHKTEDDDVHKKHRRIIKLRSFLYALSGALIIWFVVLLIAIGQFSVNIFDVRDYFKEAKINASEMHFEKAIESINKSIDSINAAQNSLVFIKTISFIPYIDSQVEHINKIVIAGSHVVDSVKDLLDLADEIIKLSGMSDYYFEQMNLGLEPDVSFGDLPTDTKKTIITRLNSSSSELELLSTRIGLVISELDTIQKQQNSGFLFDAVEPFIDQIKNAEEQLHLLSIAARILPGMAGLDEEQNHLVLFLNNDELRPGGGFIGTYGLLKIKDTEILLLQVDDVYALDKPSEKYNIKKSPEPIKKYIGESKWYMRDGNWSPDFAVSSLNIIDQFITQSKVLSVEQKKDVPNAGYVDSVIGFTPIFAANILGIVGPQNVSGQIFTSENIATKIEYEVEKGFQKNGIPYSQRKKILADLVLLVQKSLYDLPVYRWSEVLNVVRHGFLNKQLFVFSSDTNLEEVITKSGFGGRVLQNSDDFQLVVDANLASLKTDPYVNRFLFYEIFKSNDGRLIGRTKIRYEHTGSFDWRTTRYRTYTRVYVPRGSKFIRSYGSLDDDKINNPTLSEGVVDIVDELGLSSFGTFISIEPGESRGLIFEYELSPTVVDAINKGYYTLDYYKQNGARDYPLTMSIDFDKNISNAIPSEAKYQWGDDVYDLNTILDQDLTFKVSL